MVDLDCANNIPKATETYPTKPPTLSHTFCAKCDECLEFERWCIQYKHNINKILFRTNYHKCMKHLCLNNKHGTCKARFPRDYQEKTEIDETDGRIILEKHKRWLNTVTPMLCYLLHCNSDTTSLLSGTAIKAAIAYITDYISKTSLKTHVIFATLKIILSNAVTILENIGSRTAQGCRLLTKLVNALIGKMEIGAPMASMYLLGNPDHYTNQMFITLYWCSFVNEAIRFLYQDEYDASAYLKDNSVVLSKNDGGVYGLTAVDDYIHCPMNMHNIPLIDWVVGFKKLAYKNNKDRVGSDDFLCQLEGSNYIFFLIVL